MPYLLLPDPLLDGLLLEPEPLELGELGDMLPLLEDDPLLDGLLLDGLLLLLEPEVPPPAELPPLSFIAASHSVREIEPSLFLSTDENVGVEPLLTPLELLGEEELEVPPAELLGDEELGEEDEELGEEELDAPPDALPEDLLLSVALGLALEPLVPEEVLCAAATPASARRAAAVAV